MKVIVLDPSRLSWSYAHCLCEALVDRACEVHLVTSHFLYSDRERPASYVQWEHFYNRVIKLYGGRPTGLLRSYVKGTEHIVDMFRLVRLLRKLRPDVIHFQQAPIPLVDRWYLDALKRVAPLVSTVHNTTPFHGEASKLQRWGFSSFLSRFDHLFVHTEYSRRQLQEALGIPNERVSVLPGGLYNHYEGVNEQKPAQAAVHNTGDDQIILFFGNISHYKGLDTLIRAFAQLPGERLARSRLLVAGNPRIPMEPIKALAHEAGVGERIIWDLRFIPEDEVHTVFEGASVVALPYRHIDRSGVLTTALSYGKPVVATRVGGFAETLQDGVHGFLVEPDDPSAMAARLEEVLSDPNRARAMSEAVLRLAKGWHSWDTVARDTIQVYQSLCDRRPR